MLKIEALLGRREVNLPIQSQERMVGEKMRKEKIKHGKPMHVKIKFPSYSIEQPTFFPFIFNRNFTF
jgi:hypothetical protein